VVVLTDDDAFWKGVAIGGGIIGLIAMPIVAIWLYSRTRRNEEQISNVKSFLENRISIFERKYYEDKKERNEEYRFLWNEIQKIKSKALTDAEKNRLLSYLDEAYREKLHR